jgi:N-succinyldiaminopimelate aminotransferase
MNLNLQNLQPYPFQKLAQLYAGASPAGLSEINLSIGEPQHPTPDFIIQALQQAAVHNLAKYPSTIGSLDLRIAIAAWLTNRFKLNRIDPDRQILPVNGTREALFAFAQAVVDNKKTKALVLMPNPFYQIYEGAALLAGAKPYYLNGHNFELVGEQVWRDCQLLYICSPSNPSGEVLSKSQLQKLIYLADKYDFVIASDECYSELYSQQASIGLLEVCADLGRDDYKRCIVFHSLSKRSNAPGLRSGFVAGDADIMQQFLLYRTYHGCAMPVATQMASIKAWQDEQHVIHNRDLYRQKFAAMAEILSPTLVFELPAGGFYIWLATPIDDREFAKQLFIQQNLKVLPGQYLSRSVNGVNPGQNRIRIALVADLSQCMEAARRIKNLARQC